MLNIVTSNQFKKDLKLIIKRHFDTDKLDEVVMSLANGKKLDARYHDHPLSGNYEGFYECHIQPDWQGYPF